MPINFKMQVAGDILRVRASGRDDDLEDVKRYGSAVIEELGASGCKGVLCDERELVYAIGTVDAYEYAKFVAENCPRVVKVAVVCHPDFIGDARFWETASWNRGLQVQVFRDIEEAEKWLEE
jgi:hypothetical protein